jgi:hypothetical protein
LAEDDTVILLFAFVVCAMMVRMKVPELAT